MTINPLECETLSPAPSLKRTKNKPPPVPLDALDKERDRLFANSNSHSFAGERKTVNEDAFFANDLKGWYGVFDGVGSSTHPEAAAQLAKQFFSRQAATLDVLDEEALWKALPRFFQEARAECVAYIHRMKERSDLKTTVTLVKIMKRDEQRSAVILQAGDTRVTVVSRSGDVRILTLDQTPTIDSIEKEYGRDAAERFQRLIDHISQADDLKLLSPEDAALRAGLEAEGLDVETAAMMYFSHYPGFGRNVITNYLGNKEKHAPDITSVALAVGDTLILTTDGVHDNLSTEEIRSILQKDTPRIPPYLREAIHDAKSSSEALCLAALAKSRSDDPRAKFGDDTTAIVATID